MMERYLVQYFLAVVEQGNFSRAAQQCRVSQPTLSVGIAKLEASVGHVLFHRTNRRVELTSMGTIFAKHARRIEAEFGRTMQAMELDQRKKLIRIGVLSTLPSAWIGSAARAACRVDGEQLEIVEGRMRDLSPRLDRGRLDAVVGILGNSEAAEPWFEEGYALALPANHPLAPLPIVEADQVADADMIVRRNCEALQDISHFFTQRGIRPFFAARTVNDDRAAAFVQAGLGITVMPRCFARPDMAMPALAGFDRRRRIGLIVDRAAAGRVADSEGIQRFSQAIREAAASA